MTRLIKFLLALSLLPLSIAWGQTTTITATVVDSDGTAWANAPYTLSFRVNPSQPNQNVYNINGVPLNPALLQYSGYTNGSGVLSQAVYQNTAISPSGSQWILQICPLSSAPACGSANVSTSGSTMDISTSINTAITAPRFPALAGAYGYADSEAQITIPVGATYWNVTLQGQRYWNGSTWVSGGLPTGVSCTGSGTSQICTFPGTIAAGASDITPVPNFSSTAYQQGSYVAAGGINMAAQFLNQQQSTAGYDAFAAGIAVPSTSTLLHQADALAAYATTSSTTTNAVGAYLTATCLANNTNCWGENPWVGSMPGLTGVHLWGSEVDVNVNNASDAGQGIAIVGRWAAQPSNMYALRIQQPIGGSGNGYYWPAGIVFDAGSVQSGTGILFNPLTSASSNVVSIGETYLAIDSSSVLQHINVYADTNGSFDVANSTTGVIQQFSKTGVLSTTGGFSSASGGATLGGSVSATGQLSSATQLSVSTPLTTPNYTLGQFLQPYLPNGTSNRVVFGVNSASLNEGYISFNYASSGSNSNSIGIGQPGVGDYIRAWPTGDVSVGGYNPPDLGFALGVNGSLAVGATNPVIIGGASGSCAGLYAKADGTGCGNPGGSGSYLPLSGGTLTGALNGTSASFSGTVAAGATTPTTISSSGVLLNGVPALQSQTSLNNYYSGGAGNLTGTGSYNSAQGYKALFSNTTGSSNTANGFEALYSNTTGNSNTANGYKAGQYIADGVTANQTSSNSVYEGFQAYPLASGDTNENVIGNTAIGHGSNTTTLGNSTTTGTWKFGTQHITATAPTASAGSVAAYSTNAGGEITGLSAATSVTITFANSGWTNAAFCTANSSTTLATNVYNSAQSNTAVTFTFPALTGNLFYHCDGN